MSSVENNYEGESSPVREVRRFEEDEAAAIALQQKYDDEITAERLQAETAVEDEFDRATQSKMRPARKRFSNT